jgi:predicted nucleic acid-binding protein
VKTVFLDANVLSSAAANPSGLPWSIITSGKAVFITSHYAVAEARRNLPLVHLPNLNRLLDSLRLVSDALAPPPAGVRLPAKDIPILATAALAGADLLVTGDQDFRQYFGRSIGGVKMILPRMLADELTES